jgi:FlaA1/EpsC-like NDP-sugar epimerase
MTMATLLLLYLADLYNFQLRVGGGELVLRIGLVTSIAGVLMAAVGFGVLSLRFGRWALLTTVGASALGLICFRLITRPLGSHQKLQKKVLVLGTRLADVLSSYEGPSGSIPFRIVGFLDDDLTAYDNIPPGYDLLGRVKELLPVVDKLRPDILLVALANMRGTLPVNDILECRFRGVRVEEWPTFCEKLTSKVLVDSLRPSWLIFSDGAVKTSVTETIKRAFDVALSVSG